MRNNLPILELTFTIAFFNFFFSLWNTFVVVFSDHYFPANAAIFGIVIAAFSAGQAAGSILVGRVRSVAFAGKAMILSSFVSALTPFLLVVLPNPLLAVLFMLIGGLMIGFAGTTWASTVQLVVPENVLGRVLGMDEALSFSTVPLSQIAGGLLIATVGVQADFLIAAAGLALIGVLQFALKGFRNLRSSQS